MHRNTTRPSRTILIALFALTASSVRAHAQADVIREITTALARPEFEGRGTGQPGGDRAAEYLAARFQALGVTGGGDRGTYFQTLPVTERVPLATTSLTVDGEHFLAGRDFGIAEPPPPYELKAMRGDAVFVGYGAVSAELHHDDLAGIDVNGKIVVLLDGAPAGVDKDAWEKAAGQRLVARRMTELGARGLIFVYASDQQGFPFGSVASFLANRVVGFVDDTSYPVKPARWSIESLYPAVDLPPSLLVNDRVAERLFRASGVSFADVKRDARRGAFVSRKLVTRVAFTPEIQKNERTASNVIARIEGSDPTLRSQAIVYTAHYDAYGIDPRGTIFPGAADNALGVGKLLAVAAQFAKQSPRPRRTIIFIATTGEEYGDLGIAYWLRHPTVPLANVAANLNFDGSVTEVWGPPGFVINYGFGQSDMGPMVRQAAAKRDIEIIPDPIPDEDFFGRGDHSAFVQRGIPTLFLAGGPLDPTVAERGARWLATDYHMPSDSVHTDWNWSGPAGVAQLAFDIGVQLAAQDSMPQWRPASKYNRPRGSEPPL